MLCDTPSIELPPPGFHGLRPDLPVVIYRRHLPHWRQAGATYLITVRLSDSLPSKALEDLRADREVWLGEHPGLRACSRGTGALSGADGGGRDFDPDLRGGGVGRDRNPDWGVRLEYERRAFARLEQWLDAGSGGCALASASAQALLAEEMNHFDGRRYLLGAYVVMPNHVHAVLRPLPAPVGRDRNPVGARGGDGRDYDPDLRGPVPLESIVGAWKRRTARALRSKPGGPPFWQDETYDHIVRDTAELRRIVRYIVRNPGKAGLSVSAWIRPDWLDWWNATPVGRDRDPAV